MQRFGGTCPMCCGDLGKDGTAVCVFCGFTSGTDYTAKDAPGISAWLQVDGARSAISWPCRPRSRRSHAAYLGRGVHSFRQPISSEVLASGRIAIAQMAEHRRNLRW